MPKARPKTRTPKIRPQRRPRPTTDAVPEWSPTTLAAFAELTPLERAFVEWYVAGMNSAEAYRKATGVEYTDRGTDTSRMNGYVIRSRPRVGAAIDAAMKDAGFDARMDRRWMLQRLQVALEKAEAFDDQKAQATVAKIIKTIAELKGEIVRRSEVVVSEEETPAVKRFRLAVEKAEALAAGRVVRVKAAALPAIKPPTIPA